MEIFHIFVSFVALGGLADDKIKELGHDDYRVREAATEYFMEHEEALLLVSRHVNDSDPEVSSRVKTVLYFHLGKVLEKWDCDVPWIDCLPDDYPDRQAMIDYYLGPVSCDPGFYEYNCEIDFPYHRGATVRLLYALVSEGRTYKELEPLLDIMKQREVKWLNAGGRFSVPSPP